MKEKNKPSAFKIVSIILIVLLSVTILVQICVMAYLKNKTDDFNDKNKNLPQIEQEYVEPTPDFSLKI